MTGSVLQFASPDVEYPIDRVQRFIALAREIEALVSHEEWTSDLWHVGHAFLSKGQKRDNRVLAFYNRDATLTNRQEIVGGAPLVKMFKEFAKAYVRYLHSTSPVAFENTMKRLDALQFIEAAFTSLGLMPAIENLNVAVLNTAVAMAKEGVGPARHYQFAIYIQQVHRFCMDRKYLNAPFQWKHGVRKPKDRTEAIGQEAKQWRDEKLPSPQAFHALAHIYRNSETFVDRLYSAISAIFVTIPIRAHEVFQLRLDCEVHDRVRDPDSGEMVDAYGIRVWPGKNNPPQVKWVPTQMASIVQEAIARIREMCTDARAVARWYEEHPGQLWLPEDLEPYRHADWLPIDAVPRLVGTSNLGSLASWLRKNGVEWRSDGGSWDYMKEVSISSLGDRLIRDLPSDFPHFNGQADQKYSETLILLLLYQVHPQFGTYPSVVEQVTVHSYGHWLSGHDKKPSVFKAWGFKEADGSDIEITSHGFRHWLNTVAQLRGLSDLDIAKWSGRNIEQNQAYNHVTSDEVLNQIKEALDDGTGVGPMFEAAKIKGVNRPVDRREFVDAQIGSALVTELGICVHDYSLLPCQTHGDCLKCSENVFIKGDSKHRERIDARLALTEKQLADALQAMGNDYHGADKWVQAHENSIKLLRRTLEIHDDPSIPDGTVVNLGGGSPDNEVAMAIRDSSLDLGEHLPRTKPTTEEDVGETEILAEMWED